MTDLSFSSPFSPFPVPIPFYLLGGAGKVILRGWEKESDKEKKRKKR